MARKKPGVSEETQVEETQETSEAGETVLVQIPKDFKFRDDDHVEHRLQAGVHRIPVAWADHWYVQANGVTVAE